MGKGDSVRLWVHPRTLEERHDQGRQGSAPVEFSPYPYVGQGPAAKGAWWGARFSRDGIGIGAPLQSATHACGKGVQQGIRMA